MTSTAQRSPRRTLATIAVGALAALALLSPASPASAHDQLVATDPAQGAVVEALPAEITLSYSAELLGDASSNLVAVTDAAGKTLADGPAIVDGTEVVQPLTGEASGPITVLWRVVSSDGHPISGEFSFTVDAPAPAEPAPGETDASAPSSSPEPTMTTMTPPEESAAPQASETPAAAPDAAASAEPLPWVIGGLVVLAIIAVVVLLLTRSRGAGDTGATGTRPGADG